jgi:hypothetical protein
VIKARHSATNNGAGPFSFNDGFIVNVRCGLAINCSVIIFSSHGTSSAFALRDTSEDRRFYARFAQTPISIHTIHQGKAGNRGLSGLNGSDPQVRALFLHNVINGFYRLRHSHWPWSTTGGEVNDGSGAEGRVQRRNFRRRSLMKAPEIIRSSLRETGQDSGTLPSPGYRNSRLRNASAL